jgi:RecA/RadA recombinase
MALRGVKPKAIHKRLKAFFYGNAKVGKTTAAIQFPKPYLIDTERGAENDKYVSLLEKGGGLIFQTNDFEEVMKEIKTLLTEKHEYKTLIIDPMTILYDDLVDQCANKVGTDYGKHVGAAAKKMKNMYSLLLRLDMNVIITSHAKAEYKMVGKELTLLGNTFDCYKKMDYMFDLILEIQKRGKDRVALVKGTRLEGFKEDEFFPFGYEEICNRYGKEILEKDCESAQLATPEQIKELKRLIELLHVQQDAIDKMLKKEEVEDFEYMSSEYIQKCIAYFTSKIQGEAA